jgi:hypothetical protein
MKKFSMNFWSLAALVAIAAVLVGGVVYVVMGVQKTPKAEKYSYNLDWLGFNDQRLIKKDNLTGIETISVSSVLKKYGQNFTIMGYSEKNNILVLHRIIPDTDLPGEGIYRLNLATLENTELKINEILKDNKGGSNFGPCVLSPDKIKLACVPVFWLATKDKAVAQKLFVADIIKDTYSSVVELASGEDFNGGTGGLSTNVSIEWLDKETIKYAVYQVTNDLRNAPLIGYREVKIR